MRLHILVLATVGFLISGCLISEDHGTTTVGNPVSAPPDFTSGQGTDPNPNDIPPAIPTPTPTPMQTIPGHIVVPNAEVDLIVNGGAERTNSSDMNLEIVAPIAFYSQMRISRRPDCTDGEWEAFADAAVRPILDRNATNIVGVRLKDDDNVVSQCVVKSIQHDDLGPEIVIANYPTANLEEGSTARISYSVDDASPIAGVVCSLNQLQKPCDAGFVNVDLTALMAGSYTFAVDAVDVLGNSSHAEVSWNVVSTTTHLVQNILINNYNKVDILIVDDNSGSMQYEQQSMAKRTSNFLSILAGLDWRISVTTTDPTPTTKTNTLNPTWTAVTDGLFIPVYGLANHFYFHSAMDPVDAQYRLGMTLQRPETGSSSEQAINAVYRSIERGFTNPSANPVQHNFFRDGAHFAVLVISDEDESANNFKNDPQNLLNYVNTTFNGQKAFSWHSIITRPNDTACKSTYGAVYGHRYNAFSLLTGGIIGSVCETDYAAQLTGVANKIRNLVKTMTLSCQPLAQLPIVVSLDGAPYSGAFTVEGVNLNFAAELPPGNYSIDYHCLK
jgi:hypothetical protein